MDAETREKIHKILDLVLDRNDRGDATFFQFAGHKNEISVDMHDGAWNTNSPCRELKSYFLYQDLGMSLDDIEVALCS